MKIRELRVIDSETGLRGQHWVSDLMRRRGPEESPGFPSTGNLPGPMTNVHLEISLVPYWSEIKCLDLNYL